MLLCYRLAAINSQALCLLINTPLGSAVITCTARRLPKEFVEDPFDCRAPAYRSIQGYWFSHFFWRFRFLSWEYTWINPWCSRAQPFFHILKIFLFDFAHHDLKLTSSASFEIHGEPSFIHSFLRQESKHATVISVKRFGSRSKIFLLIPVLRFSSLLPHTGNWKEILGPNI